jgi:hypothetical protein
MLVRSAGEVDADVETELLAEQVLKLATFDDTEPVVADGERPAFRADPCHGDEDSGRGAVSSTEPARARTLLAKTHLR